MSSTDQKPKVIKTVLPDGSEHVTFEETEPKKKPASTPEKGDKA